MPSSTTLVIVESKAKAPKIEQILGAGYKVLPCFGHLQNIPRSGKWIDAHRDSGWDPDQIPYEKNADKFSADALAKLRRAAKAASKVIIASDMDREGEAIGYHLRDLLRLPKARTQRIVFDQITPQAIRQAVEHPTELRESLYRAQQARRVIDQIFGYTVSPLLWNIQQRLSAGRCQSPALRWLWERQEAFLNVQSVPAVHHITAQLTSDTKTKTNTMTKGELPNEPCTAKYVEPVAATPNSKPHKSRSSKQQADAAADTAADTDVDADDHAILYELQAVRKWVVSDATHTQPKQAPPTPFTTSALQQRCYQRFKWSPKSTMTYAQKLYEAGLITYMRTDCKRLAASFVAEATEHLLGEFGAAYVQSATPSPTQTKPRKSTKQALAQEAHEPIRPTHASHAVFTAADRKSVGASVAAACAKLYTLIYQTTMSSLMTPCILNKWAFTLQPAQAAQVSTSDSVSGHRLAMEWSGISFPGWRVWEVMDAPKPFQPPTCPYTKGHVFATVQYVSEIKHPIANRPYTAGDLLKLLETRGVGRPSTYSSILEKLEERKYVADTGSGQRTWQAMLDGHPLTKLQNETVTIDMRPSQPKWSREKSEPDVAKQLQDRYCVTPLGGAVTRFLVSRLVDLVDAEFTQKLESQLDDIVQGKDTYQSVVSGFYTTLTERVAKLRAEVREHETALRGQKGRASASASASSAFAHFDNGVSKRLLEDNGESAYVAMLTRNGPAVALLYADKARKSEGVFATLPASSSVENVTLATAKKLLAAKQESIKSGATSEDGVRVGVHRGATIHAKSGRYGNYLTWTDKDTGEPQTATFGDPHVQPEQVTLAQAAEWVDRAKLLLRKVDSTFAIRYNPEWENVFISKKPASGRGRPTYATLEGFTKADMDRIRKLSVKDVKDLYERGQQTKQQNRALKVSQRKGRIPTGSVSQAGGGTSGRGRPATKTRAKGTGTTAGGRAGTKVVAAVGKKTGASQPRKRSSSRKAAGSKRSQKQPAHDR